MADDQSGLKKDYLREFAPWTRLFSAFKVAMDPKKLLLAGGGVLAMALGWWILSAIYFSFNQNPPQPEDFKASDYEVGGEEAAWKAFKSARQHWNLTFEMAGTTPETYKEAKEKKWIYDAADFAESRQDWENIKKEYARIKSELARRAMIVTGTSGDDQEMFKLEVDKLPLTIQSSKENIETIERRVKNEELRLRDLDIRGMGENVTVKIKDIPVRPLSKPAAEKIKDFREKSRTVEEIKAEVANNLRNKRLTDKAIELQNPKVKPSGRLRTLPWFEDRGPNPYLLITGNVKMVGTEGTTRHVPWERGEFLTWLGNDQAPVLLEPLVKFLRPIVYLLDPAAGGWNRIYLFLVILVALAVWGFFGGAIMRMAAVQVCAPTRRSA